MRIAIYTCITGGYDDFREPETIESDCDYYYISDKHIDLPQGFRFIDVDTLVPDKDISPKDKNRYCKMHPYEIFAEYDFTIYFDGSIQLIKPISHYIHRVGTSGLAIHRHRERDCVYSEGIFLVWLGAAKKDDMLKDVGRYVDAGLPKHFGLFEGGMIVTDIHNPTVRELYRNWYDEYLTGMKRDQQALILTLWKMGMETNVIGDIGEGHYNILSNPDIRWDRGAHYK